MVEIVTCRKKTFFSEEKAPSNPVLCCFVTAEKVIWTLTSWSPKQMQNRSGDICKLFLHNGLIMCLCLCHYNHQNCRWFLLLQLPMSLSPSLSLFVFIFFVLSCWSKNVFIFVLVVNLWGRHLLNVTQPKTHNYMWLKCRYSPLTYGQNTLTKSDI